MILGQNQPLILRKIHSLKYLPYVIFRMLCVMCEQAMTIGNDRFEPEANKLPLIY
jgi:hypothetical protein